MSLPDPKTLYCRHWWWSQKPFYKYEDANKQGWGHLADIHPGMFNLAWALGGGVLPPANYGPYVSSTQWVLSEAGSFKLAGMTLADWAFIMNFEDFQSFIVLQRSSERWKTLGCGMSYKTLVGALKYVSLSRA